MDLDITKSDIEKLIEIRREDKWLNHFLKFATQDYRPTGEIGKAEIKIWKLNFWVGAFYPIFIFKLNTNNKLLSISSKLNSFGKSLFIFLFILLISAFIKIDFAEMKLFGAVFIILLCTIFISIFVLVTFKIYSFERKEQLKIIYKILSNNK